MLYTNKAIVYQIIKKHSVIFAMTATIFSEPKYRGIYNPQIQMFDGF